MANATGDSAVAMVSFGEIIGNSTGNASSAETPTVDMQQCTLFRFVLYVVAMGIMCLFGFVGNTVSFMVLHKDRSTPVASFLLKSLAVADNIFLLLWVIHYSVRDALSYFEVSSEDRHVSWMYVRIYSFPVLYMAQTLTIWLTVVIALNRFMAVCLPYRAPHLCNIINVYKEVAVVTVFSIVYNVPRFFEIEIVDGTSPVPSWNRTSLGNNAMYKKVYTDGLYYLFTFVLPLLILAFVNTRVIIAYQATQKRRRRMSTRRSDNENNITLVMIMVVVIFMLCQAPARIVQCVWNYTYKHCNEYKFYLIHISNTLEVLNSSVNFLIYCIFHKRFRDILYASYCCGPIGDWARKDSQRFTTTEGLSLEEANVTMSASRKSTSKTSSSKGSDPSRNGSIRNAPAVKNQATSTTTVPVHNTATHKADCYKEPCARNGTTEDGASQPLKEDDNLPSSPGIMDTMDDVVTNDATEPLTPCK